MLPVSKTDPAGLGFGVEPQRLSASQPHNLTASQSGLRGDPRKTSQYWHHGEVSVRPDAAMTRRHSSYIAMSNGVFEIEGRHDLDNPSFIANSRHQTTKELALVDMEPLVWSSWFATLAAAFLFLSLLSVELRTSRIASRADDDSPVEIETRTGQICDAAFALCMVGGFVSSVWVPESAISPRLPVFALGLFAMASGLVLSASARRHLGRFHRDHLTHHMDHQLVQNGPYQWVRHPLYTSTILAIAGIGLTLGTWVSIGLVVLPIIALVHRIKVEEQLLERALGQIYQDYADSVSRLVPHIW